MESILRQLNRYLQYQYSSQQQQQQQQQQQRRFDPESLSSWLGQHPDEVSVLRELPSRIRAYSDLAPNTAAITTVRGIGIGQSAAISRIPMDALPSGNLSSSTAPPHSVPTKVECRFYASMNDEVVVRRVTTVEVVVSREDLGIAEGPGTNVRSGELDPSHKLILQLIPKTLFETVNESRGEFDPPTPGQPLHAYFDVRPTEQGDGELWVMAWQQGQTPLLTLILKPKIVGSLGTQAHRIAVNTAAELPPVTASLHQLRIVEQSHGGGENSYLYTLDCGDLGILDIFESRRFVGDRTAYVNNLYQQIESRWISTGRDAVAFNEDLRGYGAQLFEELFPENLQQILWDNRDRISSILVISTEPFIPWEIVHLKQPNQPLSDDGRFFGQIGLVRWLYGTRPPEVLRVAQGRARFIVPDYPHPDWKLPQAQREVPFLKERFGATAVVPEKTQVRKLLAHGDAFDLLHFAGHGTAEQGNIANARIMLQGRIEGSNFVTDWFDATAVRMYARFGVSRPIVLLNACQIGRVGYQLTGIGGFAKAFLERGAGVFVGSLWSVGDYPARTFTEAWYDALLSGSPLSEATILAREQARRAHDATWLAYVVYGHPHAKLAPLSSIYPRSP
ncbi:MAG: CHAT domain-containing protein [Verrucomicrobia bacterium]|nr:CHAT domain-containing protein [Verrucomicrobiota bacterium]